MYVIYMQKLEISMYAKKLSQIHYRRNLLTERICYSMPWTPPANINASDEVKALKMKSKYTLMLICYDESRRTQNCNDMNEKETNCG